MIPALWREGHDGSAACAHRDCSVCPACAAAYPQALEVYGAHFWIEDPAEREELRRLVAASDDPIHDG